MESFVELLEDIAIWSGVMLFLLPIAGVYILGMRALIDELFGQEKEK